MKLLSFLAFVSLAVGTAIPAVDRSNHALELAERALYIDGSTSDNNTAVVDLEDAYTPDYSPVTCKGSGAKYTTKALKAAVNAAKNRLKKEPVNEVAGFPHTYGANGDSNVLNNLPSACKNLPSHQDLWEWPILPDGNIFGSGTGNTDPKKDRVLIVVTYSGSGQQSRYYSGQYCGTMGHPANDKTVFNWCPKD